MQDKLGASNQRAGELEAQLTQERERAVSAEEHSKAVERQLAEEQQSSERLAKKRDDSEAELAAQASPVTTYAAIARPCIVAVDRSWVDF